jgi:nicotinate dehydrogenase subunit A
MQATIRLHVNGKNHTLKAELATPLLYVLRNDLSLNGPKYGCGLQQCGSCMVLMDGKAEPSCMIPASACENKKIITLEGLASGNGELHPVQKAFVEEQAAQCGYCLNGMVMNTVALLKENPKPDDDAIKAGLQRSLCRCGSQSRIIKAVKRASGQKAF